MKYLLLFLLLLPAAAASTIGVYPTKLYFDDSHTANRLSVFTENDYIARSELDIFEFQKEEKVLIITLKRGTLPKGFYQSYIIIQENGQKISPAVAIKAYVNLTGELRQSQIKQQDSEITSYAASSSHSLDADTAYLFVLAITIIAAIMVLSAKYVPKNIFSKDNCRRH